MSTTSDPININLKNDQKHFTSCKSIHSEKRQAPVNFAINKSFAKPLIVGC